MKKSILLFYTVFLFFTSSALAINFNGSVRDDLTQQPIAGAIIRVFNGNDQVANSTSNADGSFNISLALGFDYRVYIDKVSYEQLRVNITTKFSAAITELPPLELSMIKLKTPITNAPIVATAPVVQLKGKVYHLQIGGLEGESILVKNNNTGKLSTTTTLPNGNFSIQIEANTNYTITVQANNNYPDYVYAPVILNTNGISSSIQIIRNFENRGIIVPNTTIPIIADAKVAVEKKDEKTIAPIVKKENTTNATKNNSTEKSTEILTDKDKALVQNLNKKYEKLILNDSLAKKKDKMVARNVVVKFYDDDQKVTKDKTKKDTLKAIEINKYDEKTKSSQPVIVKDETKKTEIKKEDKQPLEKTPNNNTTKAIESKKVVDAPPIVKTPVVKEQSAEDKRIDSMIGTAPRFMHHDLTKEDKARTDATKTTTANTVVKPLDKTNSLLPIAENETRTPVIDNKIYYGEGKASFDEEAKKYLTEIANKLKSNPSLKIEIAIHSDLNNEASITDYICKLRIKRIVELMVNQLNVNFQQLVIRSVGTNEPVNSCKKGDMGCSELDHQMNRRTELKFLN